MTAANFEGIAASIATMPAQAIVDRMWSAMRAMAQGSPGRNVVVFVAVFGQVRAGRGVGIIDFDALAAETGLSARSVAAAFAGLERAGLVLGQTIGGRLKRATLPCLVQPSRERPHRSVAHVEGRQTH
jgi:hypothetical protein